MTLSELSRWGVVRKVWIQGERKDFYAAEVQLWRMISRVFNEREKARSRRHRGVRGGAGAAREDAPARPTRKSRAKAELQHERISQLLELAKLGGRLLDALFSTAKLDAEPLVRFLLGRGPSASGRGDRSCPRRARDGPCGGQAAARSRSNNYALEFFQGPLIAPNRIIGVGGAYTALAEGDRRGGSATRPRRRCASPSARLVRLRHRPRRLGPGRLRPDRLRQPRAVEREHGTTVNVSLRPRRRRAAVRRVRPGRRPGSFSSTG